MSEAWYAVVEEETGKLVSTGTVVASILPMGMIKIPIGGPPDSGSVWNETRQQFVMRPEKKLTDRLDDFLKQPGVSVAIESLKNKDAESILDSVIWILGKRRYRSAEADPTL